MMTAVEKRRPRELTVADRCDRCSARAVVETVMMGGGSLMWCAHHFGRFEESLTSLGATILTDNRD
ncbi:MAG TPA: hypothetical protein VGH11_11455 [Jatrophihabitans sp.]